MTARPGRIVAPILALALAGGVLTGCSGGSSEPGSSSPSSTSTTATSSTTSTAATTTTTTQSSTSNATYAGAPGVPEEAKFKTDAGAIAFAKYYLETVNKVGKEPKVGVLEPLALPSCKTCKAQQLTVADDLKKSGRHVAGDQFTIVSAHRITGYQTEMVVNVICTQPKIEVVDASGAIVESYPAEDSRSGMVFNLRWQDGWRAATIKIDEGGVA